MNSARRVLQAGLLLLAGLAGNLLAQAPPPIVNAAAEQRLFTPPGFDRPGRPVTATGAGNARVHLRVRDRATGQLTPCRVTVVGADGNYYQPPAPAPLAMYAMPVAGVVGATMGNRAGMGPFRYWGYFFYSLGETTVELPAGTARVEVWKGLEYQPATVTAQVSAGATAEIAVELENSGNLAGTGYRSGDVHLHLPRVTPADDEDILHLLAAEDLHYGAMLAGSVVGQYDGDMTKMLVPQQRGLGRKSVVQKDGYAFLSAQEYRNHTAGHLNLYLLDDLVLAGAKFNSDDWPLFGSIGQETRQRGGISVLAHGGYDKEVYAAVALGAVDAVELLQFGEYRGIKLPDWYDMLNTGYRVACLGGSDYPYCRAFADCRMYVRTDDSGKMPPIDAWLRGAVDGRSFVTTAPLLLLEVDGARPGDIISSDSPRRLIVKIRVRSAVAPVKNLDLVVNGRSVAHVDLPPSASAGEWFEWQQQVSAKDSVWIAARAWATAPDGRADSEAHTNPVYCYIGGKRPFVRESAGNWIAHVDQLAEKTAHREFAEKPAALAYFRQAREALARIQQDGGLPADFDFRKFADGVPPVTVPAARP